MATTHRARQCDLATLELDDLIQPRASLDDDAIADYAEAMTAGAEFPPLAVFFDGETHWLADGFHRVKAATRIGLTTLAATVHRGTKRDAALYAVGANQTHGIR